MRTGWHFTRPQGRLGHDDERRVFVGATLTVEGELRLGEHGLHFSERVIDALRYAPGSQLWRVEGSAELIGHGIYCGYSRTALVDFGDVLPLIVEFATWCMQRARGYARDVKSSCDPPYSADAEHALRTSTKAAARAEEAAARAEAAALDAVFATEDTTTVAARAEAAVAAAAVAAAATTAAAVAGAPPAATGGFRAAADADDAAVAERESHEDWWQVRLRTTRPRDSGAWLAERSLASRVRLGPPRFDVTSLNNLALLYDAQGRYAEAEPLYKQSLESFWKFNYAPPGDPAVPASLNNLAAMCEEQGRYAEAEPLYAQAVKIAEIALGPAHPTTEMIRRNLGVIRNRRS